MSLNPAENPTSTVPQEARKAERPGDRRWIFILLASLLLLIAVWIAITPPGFWNKWLALGYSICHQISARSFFIHEHQSPLCARCTGMFLGAILGLGWQLFNDRKGAFPPLWIVILLGLWFLWFAFDGVNSFLNFLPAWQGPYLPSQLLRLITGFGVGLGIACFLAPAFKQAVWQNWQGENPFKQSWRFFALLGCTFVLIAGLNNKTAFIYYPAVFLSGFSVPLLLSLLYTMLAVMALRRENQYLYWKELLLPFLMGSNLAMAQILVISLVRLYIFKSWSPIALEGLF